MNGPCLLPAQLLDLKRIAVWTVASLLTALLTFLGAGCQSGPAPLTAEVPLHLEDYLHAASVEGSEVPAEVPSAVEWRFDEPQPGWKPVAAWFPKGKPVQVTRTKDALRLTLTEAHRRPQRGSNRRLLLGRIYIDLPDWRREDWAYVLVRVRTSGDVGAIGVGFNLREQPAGPWPWQQRPFLFDGEYVHVISDGSVQTYLMRADWSWEWEGPWRQLGIYVTAREPASLDILSISVIPKEATYAEAPVGMRTDIRKQAYRRTLYTHTPGRLEYRVRVPEGGRLDLGLGVLRDDAPVTFRITARPDGGEAEILLEEPYADKEHWAQRSVDLSSLAGKTVTLALEANAERAGTVALWAVPTLSGARATDKPNIIFYIIDGAGADFMSVYGYNRRTTSNLELLATEGAVFEHAYSNSTWTKVSTPSFMTSLHHSVLGGYKHYTDPLPEQAVTMAQHMHGAGYQTAVFTSNPIAATLSGLERGVDVLRDAGVDPNSASSEELHEDFWKWREAYPGEPYWVHFQTTDVHEPYRPVAPFAGLFVTPELREAYIEWDRKVWEAGGSQNLDAYEKAGVSRAGHAHAQQGLYDEAMAHNDYQLGRLVERLKASGEWEHTLLIVAADHGYPAAGHRLLDPFEPRWRPYFNPHETRIPMLFIWPGHIKGGQRFSQPVSMIDMLPTILDLAGLPMPEVMQGQSLAPLLLGDGTWEPRPVIFDMFAVDPRTGELRGNIEVIDGRWGASLEINPSPPEEESPVENTHGDALRKLGRPSPLLLYDLWSDPYCLRSLHEDRPDLVEKYTQFLEAQWEAHRALAQRFTKTGETPLTPEQIRTLRSLGYVQ